MFKKVLSICLSLAIVFTFTGTSVLAAADSADYTAAANNLSVLNDEYLSIRDYIANSIMLSDTITEFENEHEVSFNFKPQDITSDIINVNSEWLSDANSFLDSYNSTGVSRNAEIASSQPSSKQSAKSDAIMYSIDRAAFSILRNPSLDFGKETQYMFISHYIDRYEYYWSTEDERYLLDGPSMSGENGYLADWITPSDRQAYDAYMRFSDVNASLQHVGNIGSTIYYNRDIGNQISTGIEAIKKANRTITTASGLVLQDSLYSIGEIFVNDIAPLADQIHENLQNSAPKLSDMYDSFMQDEEFLSLYSEPDKAAIVRTSLCIVGAFIIGGPSGAVSAALSALSEAALNLTVNNYNDLFNYAAWAALRYGFSGRYAGRVMYYWTGVAY